MKQSIAHVGYTRIALLEKWSTFDNPWPGLHAVDYIVQKDGGQKIIARSEIFMLARPFSLAADQIECEDLQRVN
jgi:hypothetical protein